MKKKEKISLRIEQEVLKILSMNARASYRFIGKRTGMSPQNAYWLVKKLEKKYGIKYLAEIDVEKLGYIRFAAIAHFIDRIPDLKDIQTIYDKDPRIQLVTTFTGRGYDLFFYVLVKNNQEINELRREITIESPLRHYKAVWYFTPFYENYNYVPIRDEFIETLKDRPLDVDEETSAPKQKLILEREFAILKEWNLDGSLDLREIDRKYGFDKGRAQYAYHKLLSSGLIKRVTITMQKLPINYIQMISIKIIDFDKYYNTRKSLLKNMLDETSTPMNRYALVGDIGGPFSVFLFLPVFRDKDLVDFRSILEHIKGVKVRDHLITNTLGRFCFRKFDSAYTIQANTLAKIYNMQPLEKINYSEKD